MSDIGWNTLVEAGLLIVHSFADVDEFLHYVREHDGAIDCLVLAANYPPEIAHVCECLLQNNRVLPAIAICPLTNASSQSDATKLSAVRTSSIDRENTYHRAVTWLNPERLKEANKDWLQDIEQAIAQFMQVSPSGALPAQIMAGAGNSSSLATQVQHHQRRLAEKLRERLGYTGVYYKRDPDRFYRHLSEPDRVALMERLQELYRSIILDYFKNTARVNSFIDEFTALAFLADLSVSQVLELHMILMDRFTKQLKLEKRNEEIVLDYRITLIDVIAHLSEMYRRSIPRQATQDRLERKQADRN